MPVTFADITNPATMFDLAGEFQSPPRKQFDGGGSKKHASFEIRSTKLKLHPKLPATSLWAYDGRAPGPTVVVNSEDHVTARFVNDVAGTLPYAHVVVNDDKGHSGSMNNAGSNDDPSTDPWDIDETTNARLLEGQCVVHLHGAPTRPDSDGWTESVISSGEDSFHHYQFPREQFNAGPVNAKPFRYRAGAAPTFWYHDHAMGATRFNVFAGLAGVWLVRDPVEKQVGLPVSEEFELPIVLQDRNLETKDGSPTGTLTGQLLHKVQKGVRECFAPATLVSGQLWPRVNVKPRVYRLRVLNGSNARFYRLHFFGLKNKQDQPTVNDELPPEYVQQIGTDSGLLGRATDLPDRALLLAPGERADVLIDFGLLAGQTQYDYVVVYNSAAAPFQGKAVPNDRTKIWSRGDDLRPVPEVMRFDLQSGKAAAGVKAKPIRHLPLDPQFKSLPTDHAQLPPHEHSLVVLREEDELIRDSNGNVQKDSQGNLATRTMLFLHEMMMKSDADRMGMNMHSVTAQGLDINGNLNDHVPQGILVRLPGPDGAPQEWVTVAKRFSDATNIFIEKDSWHMWKVLNLSPDTHPFHIHLTQFQAVSRQRFRPDRVSSIPKPSTEFSLLGPPDPPADPSDPGWKDTMRVNPGERTEDGNDDIIAAEMLTLFAQFKRHAGRYMYHCHILEHEDTEMMRPFVVLPKALMSFMGMSGSM